MILSKIAPTEICTEDLKGRKENTYRMICAIHFNTGKVFMLRFMTHANYSKAKWKNEL
jgi:mRNA-degrading endonuclease HigB of HigAB toxin-antitoxin module